MNSALLSQSSRQSSVMKKYLTQSVLKKKPSEETSGRRQAQKRQT